MLTILLFSLHQEPSQNETSSRSPALSRLCDLLRGGCCKGGRSDRVQKKVSIGARPPASALPRSWSCGASAPPRRAPAVIEGTGFPAGIAQLLKGLMPFQETSNKKKTQNKTEISALAKIIAPRMYLVWLPPRRLALTGCPLPLRSFQMDEMGTEPSEAGREAFGHAPRAGGSRRPAAAHTDPGREGGSPSLASQVNSSPFWARALARDSGKFQDPLVSGCLGLFSL